MYMLTFNQNDLVFYPHLVFMYMERDKILQKIRPESTVRVVSFEYGVDKIPQEIFIGHLDSFGVWLDRRIDSEDSSDDEQSEL